MNQTVDIQAGTDDQSVVTLVSGRPQRNQLILKGAIRHYRVRLAHAFNSGTAELIIQVSGREGGIEGYI